MPERKQISKRTRFDVLKRDKFTCQYCGKSAPDVVLHIDHIVPVSKGGTNDIINLVTSCAECNLGKSNIELSDESAIAKQRKHLEELEERREQLEMMFEWQRELLSDSFNAIDKVDEAARRRDDDLCSALQRPHLLHNRRTAIDGHDVHARQVFREVFQVVADLQTEFSRRTQNQRLRLSVVGVERLQERNAEGGGFSCARLCEGNQVGSPLQTIFRRRGFEFVTPLSFCGGTGDVVT